MMNGGILLLHLRTCCDGSTVFGAPFLVRLWVFAFRIRSLQKAEAVLRSLGHYETGYVPFNCLYSSSRCPLYGSVTSENKRFHTSRSTPLASFVCHSVGACPLTAMPLNVHVELYPFMNRLRTYWLLTVLSVMFNLQHAPDMCPHPLALLTPFLSALIVSNNPVACLVNSRSPFLQESSSPFTPFVFLAAASLNIDDLDRRKRARKGVAKAANFAHHVGYRAAFKGSRRLRVSLVLPADYTPIFPRSHISSSIASLTFVLVLPLYDIYLLPALTVVRLSAVFSEQNYFCSFFLVGLPFW